MEIKQAIKEELDYLDAILRFFKKIYPGVQNDKSLYWILKGEEPLKKRPQITHEEQKGLNRAKSLCSYLVEKKYLEIVPQTNTNYRLAIDGLMFIQKGGFLHQYKLDHQKSIDEDRRFKLQERFHKTTALRNYILIRTSIIALVLSIGSLCFSIWVYFQSID